MSSRALMVWLGYAGLLPFYAAALWAWLGLDGAQAGIRVLVVYSAVILAFLGGTLWGYAANRQDDEKRARLLLSNAVALLAALAALIGSAAVGIALLAAGHLAVLGFERGRGNPDGWYLRLRTRLTVGLLPPHGLALLAVS